jgi:hypothetical protein
VLRGEVVAEGAGGWCPAERAVALGRIHADAAHDPTPATVEASVAEMESL